MDDVKRDALARVMGDNVGVRLDVLDPMDDVKRDAAARVIGADAVRVGVLDALEDLVVPIEDVNRDAAARDIVLELLLRLDDVDLLDEDDDDDERLGELVRLALDGER
ncbi:MAG: hypothetical protein AAGK28_09770 [Pseudomonadota bacterium]